MLPTCMSVTATACTDVRVVVVHVHRAALKNMPFGNSIRKCAQSFHFRSICGMLTLKAAANLDACPMQASYMRAIVSPLSSA